MIRNPRPPSPNRNRIHAITRELEHLNEALIRTVVARAATTTRTAEWLARERELEQRVAVLETELEKLRGEEGGGLEEIGWRG